MVWKRLRGKTTAWLWTALAVIVAIEFISAAVQKLAGAGTALQPFHELDWPLWTAYVTAIGEIVGSLALINPPTRIVGGLLLTAIMVGAASANIINGHPEYLWLNILLAAACLVLAWQGLARRRLRNFAPLGGA